MESPVHTQESIKVIRSFCEDEVSGPVQICVKKQILRNFFKKKKKHTFCLSVEVTQSRKWIVIEFPPKYIRTICKFNSDHIMKHKIYKKWYGSGELLYSL